MLPSSVARLIVGFEGSRAEVDWMVRQLEDEWRQQGVLSLTTTRDAETAPLWEWLAEFPAHVQISVSIMSLIEILLTLSKRRHS